MAAGLAQGYRYASSHSCPATMKQTSLIITFTTTASSAPAFRSLLEGVARDLPTVAGCRGVEIYSAAVDACLFTLIEQWDSRDAHEAHVKNMVDSGAWDNVAAHLACPPVSQYFVRLPAAGGNL